MSPGGVGRAGANHLVLLSDGPGEDPAAPLASFGSLAEVQLSCTSRAISSERENGVGESDVIADGKDMKGLG